MNLIWKLVSLLLRLRFSKNSRVLNFLFRLIFQLSSWSRPLVCIFLNIWYLLSFFLLSLLWFGSFVDLDRDIIVICILILVHHLSASHSYLVFDFWLYVPQIWWIFTRYLSITVIFLMLRAMLIPSLSWLIALNVVHFFQIILRSVLYHNYLMLWVILILISISLGIFLALLSFVNWLLI